jgi:hypothetical protein
VIPSSIAPNGLARLKRIRLKKCFGVVGAVCCLYKDATRGLSDGVRRLPRQPSSKRTANLRLLRTVSAACKSNIHTLYILYKSYIFSPLICIGFCLCVRSHLYFRNCIERVAMEDRRPKQIPKHGILVFRTLEQRNEVMCGRTAIFFRVHGRDMWV